MSSRCTKLKSQLWKVVVMRHILKLAWVDIKLSFASASTWITDALHLPYSALVVFVAHMPIGLVSAEESLGSSME